ncbi:MAG: hypothetical protein U0353_23995 [Sandaracinus sp.]
MSANTVEPGTAPSGEPEGCGGLLARLLWMAGGTFGITATLLGITASGDEIGGRDVVLLALVIATLLVRYVDIAHFGGRTAQGEPANMATFSRYAVGLVLLVGSVWAAIRFLFT